MSSAISLGVSADYLRRGAYHLGVSTLCLWGDSAISLGDSANCLRRCADCLGISIIHLRTTCLKSIISLGVSTGYLWRGADYLGVSILCLGTTCLWGDSAISLGVSAGYLRWLVPLLKQSTLAPREIALLTPGFPQTSWQVARARDNKPNGMVHLYLSPTRCNQVCIRPVQRVLTINNILSKLTNACYLTIIDANSVYHSLQLDKELSYLTTFACHFGRYRFTRLQFGVALLGGMLQWKINEIFNDLPMHLLLQMMF